MSPRADSLRTGERAAALVAADAQSLADALAIAPADPAGVHEARKSIRRLRSVLALGRRALGRGAVDAIDGALRALAKDLSALRDGQVVQDVARQLAREADDADERTNWEALLPLLARRQDRRLAKMLGDDRGFVRRQAEAHRQAAALQRLPWQRLHGNDLRQALEQSARRQASAQATALASVDADTLHEWRRRSRRLRMQLTALRKLRVRLPPLGPGARARHVTRLVDELGVLQDLALLSQALDAMELAGAGRSAASMRRLRTPSPIQPLV